MTDEALMQAVSQGDLQKAAVLFERYKQKVYQYFLYTTQNRTESDDLTQNVFLRMLKYRSSYNADYAFKPWLFGIARNLRARHFEKSNQAPLPLQEEKIQEVEQSAEVRLEQLEVSAQLQFALADLDETDRELIVMSKILKVKQAEIAEMLGLSTTHVKVKVHRALGKLREIYFQYEKH
ncbi:RNA polymerase sigma factor [Sediminitomix flava]|uniref:RNA polymerase sigma-70 factor (ECF subfamily) n=1 Tax=Sediminitomix flava TaxID=379075 RepID=A0A315ZIE2_SEDFL|nr:RNA polymerase sigma factor [Sediminitomix flava]PWJ45072.1 RNA polymerase sigma-70 factor (ECF subfamily) [Sediminitomix flava]